MDLEGNINISYNAGNFSRYMVSKTGNLTLIESNTFAGLIPRLVVTAEDSPPQTLSIIYDTSNSQINYGYSIRSNPFTTQKGTETLDPIFCLDGGSDCRETPNLFYPSPKDNIGSTIVFSSITNKYNVFKNLTQSCTAGNIMTRYDRFRMCEPTCYSINTILFSGECQAYCFLFAGFYSNFEDKTCVTQCPHQVYPLKLEFQSSEVGECRVCSTFLYINPIYTYPNGNIKHYCLDNCPTEAPKAINTPLNQCTDSCNPVETTLTPTSNFHLEYTDSLTGITNCVAVCPSTHRFINRYSTEASLIEADIEDIPKGICSTSCAPNTHILLKNGQTYCVTSCTGDNADLDEFSNTCTSGCPFDKPYLNEQGECTDKCLLFDGICLEACPLFFRFINDGMCSISCLPDQFVSNPENLDGMDGTCQDSCSDFLLSFSEGEFLVKYCLEECPLNYFILEGGTNECVKDCTETTKPFSAGNKCVSSCVGAGYKYIGSSNECLNDCSNFIDQNYCLSECPVSRPFLLNNNCVASCPENNKFIINLNECAQSCDDLIFDNFCIKTCENEELRHQYFKLNLNYNPKPFKLSSGVCSAACSEDKYPFINTITKECLPTCPSSLPIIIESNVCTDKCKTPFLYEFDGKCFNDCPEIAPFLDLEDNKCLKVCPPELPIIEEIYLSIQKSSLTCTDKCTNKYLVEENNSFYCKSACPDGFIAEGSVCKQNCDSNLGLIKEGNKCRNCFSEGLFVLEDKCVDKCPSLMGSNSMGKCLNCSSLGLWVDPIGRCVSETICKKYPFVNTITKECGFCSEPGTMVVHHMSDKAKCEETSCENGAIYIENELPHCYSCDQYFFLHNRQCYSSCPYPLQNDFINFSCTQNCSASCSAGCCHNSLECSLGSIPNKCHCKTNFYGESCTFTNSSVQMGKERMEKYLIFKADSLSYSDIHVFIQHSYLPSNRNLSVADNLLSILYNYVNSHYIESAYQPNVLHAVDAFLMSSLSSEDFPSEMIEFLFALTDKILIFNSTSNTVPSFEIVNESVFEGYSFDFEFGANAKAMRNLNINDCFSELPEGNYSYKIIKLKHSKLSEESFSETESLTFPPKTFLSLYSASGKVNLSKCHLSLVDSEFVPDLSLEDRELSKKFNEMNVNLFNLNDSFFVDRCKGYAEGDKDISLTYRRENLFRDPTEACSESVWQVCEINSFTDEGLPICKCSGIRSKPKTSIREPINIFPQSNYALLLCPQVFFESELHLNLGIAAVLVPLFLLFGSAIVSLYQIESTLDHKNKYLYFRTDLSFLDPESMDIFVYFDECYKLEKHIRMFTKKRLSPKNNSPKPKAQLCLPTLEDLQQLPLEDQLLFDKRSTFQFAKDIFFEKHIILNTFFLKSLAYPKYYRILLLLMELNMQTAMGALFIDDELLDDLNEIEEPTLIDTIKAEFMVAFWATFSVKIVVGLLNFIYNAGTQEKEKLLTRMKPLNTSYLRLSLINYYSNTRNLMFAFTGVVFVLNLVFAYFLVIYTEVFKNSNHIWINNILIGWLLDYVIIETTVPALIIFSRYMVFTFDNFVWLHKFTSGVLSLKMVINGDF